MSILPSHLKPLSVRVQWGAVTPLPGDWDDIHDQQWRLWWALDDGIRIDHARGTLHLPRQRVVLLPAGGTYRVQAPGRPILLFLLLDVPFLAEALATTGPLLPQLLPQDEVLSTLARRADGGRRGATPPGWAEGLAWSSFALWMESLPEAQRAALAGIHDDLVPVMPLLRHIDDHLAEPLTVPGIAAAVGLSEDAVLRLVRRHLRTTPTFWIRLRRCARAAELLTSSPLPIEAVARQCGFANRFHFSRAFTAYTRGVPPAAYRRQATGA